MSKAAPQVIGVVHNHDTWFYVEIGPKGDPANHLTPLLALATRFDDEMKLADAMAMLREFPYNMLTLRIMDIHKCPKCGEEFVGVPALSREDNETEICTKCGIREAVEAYENSLRK